MTLTETIQLAAGDLRIHVLPERGLDIGRAWLGDTEFAWISPLDEGPWQGEFARSFTGGLLTTCGLRNVGAPSEGQPQHGWYSSLPARDIEISVNSATARVVEADVPGDWLELTREIEVDDNGLTVRDTTVNQGWDAVPAPLLYHVNFWWSSVEVDSAEVQPRDEDARAGDWRTSGPPGPERVYEHVGASRAEVRHESVRAVVTSTLPRLWQWVHPGYGVLGIEPANCSVMGRGHDRAQGRLPVLQPDEQRVSELRIAVAAA